LFIVNNLLAFGFCGRLSSRITAQNLGGYLMSAKRASHISAQIEMLESRRLLSAAPVSLTALAAATPAAVHQYPTVPNIVGTYTGSFASSKGLTGTVSIALASEGTTGKLAGTLTVEGYGTVNIKGTVNVKGKFSLHGSGLHLSLTLSGAASTDLNTLAGKFNAGAKHGSAHGTFSASKAG